MSYGIQDIIFSEREYYSHQLLISKLLSQEYKFKNQEFFLQVLNIPSILTIFVSRDFLLFSSYLLWLFESEYRVPHRAQYLCNMILFPEVASCNECCIYHLLEGYRGHEEDDCSEYVIRDSHSWESGRRYIVLHWYRFLLGVIYSRDIMHQSIVTYHPPYHDRAIDDTWWLILYIRGIHSFL